MAQLKTALNASPEEISAATKRTMDNIVALSKMAPPPGTICAAGYLVKWGQKEIADKMGLYLIDREKDQTTPAFITWGRGESKQEWGCTRNGTNRPKSDDNMKFLFRHAIQGTYTITGEALIFDSEDNAGSAQHRLGGCFLATLHNPDLTFYFIVQDGIDPLLIDFIDTGKSRTVKDASLRHPDFLREDSLRNLQGLPYGPKVKDVRKQIAGDVATAMSIVWHRAHGKDVNASTTDYSKDKAQYANMLGRFATMEWENQTTEGVETIETTTLERAAQLVYAYDRETGGAIGKFGRGNFLAGLILASNVDNPANVAVNSTTNQMGRATSKVGVEFPDMLALDLELVEAACHVAKDKGKEAPFYPLYGYLETRKGRNAIDKQYKFGAMVNALKFFVENRGMVTFPANVNEAGQVIQPAREVASCPPLPGNMMPVAPRTRTEGGKQIVPPLNYPHFGGLDIGLIDAKSMKAQAALEASLEDEIEAVEA